MKKFSKVLVFVLAFISFATVQSKAQEITKEKVQVELENGVVSFVNAVRPAYVQGMTLDKFKVTLVGKSNALNITKEGSNLLNKAFALVSSNSSDAEIKKQGIKEFAAVAKYVLEYNKANNLTLKDDKGSAVVFGGNADELNQTLTTGKAGCKWYQIGCHLTNLWNWINENSGAIGVFIDVACRILGC